MRCNCIYYTDTHWAPHPKYNHFHSSILHPTVLILLVINLNLHRPIRSNPHTFVIISPDLSIRITLNTIPLLRGILNRTLYLTLPPIDTHCCSRPENAYYTLHTDTSLCVCAGERVKEGDLCFVMVEAQSWTTRRGSNPRMEPNSDQVLDIPVTPTAEIRQHQYVSLICPNITTVAIIASWYFSNIGVLLLNKYLLSFYGYRYPIFLTMLHMLSCATYSLLAIKWLEIVPFQQIHSKKQFFNIFALSVIFCFSVVCGNTSLRYLPVSFNQAIGATTPFFTAIFAFVITCKKESAEVYFALVPVVLGIVLASNSEPLFHLFGFLVCVGSTAGRALKSVVQGILLTSEGEKLHSMNLLLYMAPMAALILLPFTWYIEGNVMAVTVEKASEDGYIVFLLVANATIAYLVNLTNFLVTKHTSALTLQVLGNAKAAVAAVVSVLIFRNPVTVMGITGFAVTLMGVILYSEAKKRSKATAH